MVHISNTVAQWILDSGKRIVTEAFNAEWDPSNPTIITRSADELGNFPAGGFVDEIEQAGAEPALKNWLHAMIQLIRTVAAICNDGLPMDMIEPEIDAADGLIGLIDSNKENE